ncbi:MAG: RNA polymerase sigma factor [Thermomicrobiales bacterium]
MAAHDTHMISDDAQRIARAQLGDAPAFEALLRQYERPLYGFIYRLMASNADDAADLLQETYIKVYRALPTIPAEVNFPAWLYRVARNCCLDELRRRRRARWIVWDGAQGASLADQAGDADPEQMVLDREGDSGVMAVLARMSPRNREALILRECEGMSCEEIGAVFGISRKAVKSMLFRARDEFRRVTVSLGLDAVSDEGKRQWAA